MTLAITLRRLAVAIAAMLAMAGGVAAPALAKPIIPANGPQSGLKVETLIVQTERGARKLKVEIADTDATREHGMMFRTKVAPDTGMLFDFPTARQSTFWMRNTLVPLDIIFITAQGRVLNIARNATPRSEALVPAAGPITAVLELRGGRAAELGIQPGDKVIHRIFPHRDR